MIAYQCPHCGAALSAPEQFAGQAGSCRQCRQPITIPRAGYSTPASRVQTVAVPAASFVRTAPPAAPMPRASAVAALVVVFLLLGLFTVLFVTWVAPRARNSDQVFTMAIPLLALVLVVVSLVAIVLMRHRLRAAAAEWLGRAAPEPGPPWRTWGIRGGLTCPFCSVPVAPARESNDLAQVLAQVNQGEMPTRTQQCTQCGNAWESRIGTRHLGTRAERSARPHYEWRPLAPGTLARVPTPVESAAVASAPLPTPVESPENRLRQEACRFTEHYAAEIARKQPSLDVETLQRMARQYAMRALMQRHGLDAAAAARLFPKSE